MWHLALPHQEGGGHQTGKQETAGIAEKENCAGPRPASAVLCAGRPEQKATDRRLRVDVPCDLITPPT